MGSFLLICRRVYFLVFLLLNKKKERIGTQVRGLKYRATLRVVSRLLMEKYAREWDGEIDFRTSSPLRLVVRPLERTAINRGYFFLTAAK